MVAAVLGLCCSVACAAVDLRKPPPDASAQPYRDRLAAVIRTHYPQLITDPMAGTPLVRVLFQADGSVVGTDMEVHSSAEALTVSEEQFSRFGYPSRRLRYIGEARVQLPANSVLVAFGGLDAADVDRELVERYFPHALVQGTQLGDGIWILFDNQGAVVSTGEEHLEPTELRSLLEARYPGIRTSDMTMTPIVGRNGRPVATSSGRPLQLYCVWLAADSPVPKK